ncbi:disintegrin and metalloproteinase domain-containing protein 19 isoform X2 [Elephas maximus indicus]|uniref:disintegrin and metalloproteinase domain-containing protein 19 isoform X2 n=1 Tax=Elephas maximus indicus TaxID=99487 RepID=UPI0021161AC2|nr:disintegrin and metalloproteinase domain-containing protein 19 isoform X2 [Elephas maximus indicus]
MPGGAGAARLCLLVLALPLLRPRAVRAPGWTRRGSEEGSLPLQHELIIPQWKTAESLMREEHPPKAELRVMAEGRELILDLEKNEDLFAPTYTETHYTPSGSPRTTMLKSKDHCFYHGTVRKAEESSVTLSTCRGVRGLIAVNSNLSYIIEPLPDSKGQHLIYRSEHLKLPPGNCGFQHSMPTSRDWVLQFTNQNKKRPRRMKREDLHSMKYVELYLVADYAEFQKNRRDQEATKHKLMEIANYADKFYRSLNIRIALVGLEVWTHGNLCEVSENPYSTLWSFLSWRRKLLTQKNHDNAQLITGMSFHGTTIGLAPLMAMCSVYQSGGVNMDHSENAIGVAATMAHEMGHNFGMSHDSADCCSASAADGGCIMAAATGHPFPRVFNGCNRKELDRYLQSGGGMCLSNMPDTRMLYGGRRCGNGYLEDGEECDCGEEEECNNPCCNASNCTLREGAECAHGSCCHRCKLLAPGTMCREQARQCDLPEFCTGKSPHCPTNFYQMDGTPCEGGQAYCYNGMCLTYQEQCQQLWGPGAQPAPDLCFEKVNVAGDTFGNCGKDMNGEHKKCNMRDAKCGKIQCQSSEARPLESNAVPIDTTIIMNGRQIRCRGTHVYRGPEEEGDMLDPGLVMTGTKCGYNHICFEGQCRNTSFFETEGCGKKCNGHGVCNNNQNCHCFQGWAPPFCMTSGPGGSIDSGPMPPESLGPVVAGVVAAIFMLMVLLLMYYYCKQNNKLGQLKPSALPSKLRQHFSCPFRMSQSSGTGHANPTFKLQTPQSKRKMTNTPEIPRKPSQPPPRPPPDYLHNGSPSASLPAQLSRAVRNAPGPRSEVERKESSRRPPPSRPAPPAPNYVLTQDFSRPRPPQKALPANPVPGRKTLPRQGGTSTLLPSAAGPQQSRPLAAPAPKFPEYRSQRAGGMTSSKT